MISTSLSTRRSRFANGENASPKSVNRKAGKTHAQEREVHRERERARDTPNTATERGSGYGTGKGYEKQPDTHPGTYVKNTRGGGGATVNPTPIEK